MGPFYHVNDVSVYLGRQREERDFKLKVHRGRRDLKLEVDPSPSIPASASFYLRR